MEPDNSKENNKKKAAAGKKNPGKQKSARTSSAKQKASKKAQPAKPAKKRIIKKPDFKTETEVSAELAIPKAEAQRQAGCLRASEPAAYIDDKFADEKYISHRKIGDYRYSIYVKPCQPEIRDALMFLNMSTDTTLNRSIVEKDDTEDEIRLKNASNELLGYIFKNCGLLRPFFYKTKYSFIVTSVLLCPIMWWEDITLDDVFAVINRYSDKDLFCVLLSYLHKRILMPTDVLRNSLKDRNHFYTYMEGAAYTSSIKGELIALYEACSFGNPQNPTLKEMLFDFLKNYYNEFKRCFESVRDIIERERDEIEQNIFMLGEVPKVTNTFLFRKTLMFGDKEKPVCLEKLAFNNSNLEYFGKTSSMVIIMGHGDYEDLGNPEDYERLGDKLKNFTDDATKQVLKLLSKKPSNIETIMEVTGMNKDGAYRLTALLIEQKILIKDDETNEYVLNREHLMNIIRLLEKYGGIEA
ncbi:MAG: hypothetical protein ACLSVG_08830 [Clostridia bacterium]